MQFRKQEKVTLRKLIRIITKVKDIEKESAGNDDEKNYAVQQQIANY